jgi:hypothetical protein
MYEVYLPEKVFSLNRCFHSLLQLPNTRQSWSKRQQAMCENILIRLDDANKYAWPLKRQSLAPRLREIPDDSIILTAQVIGPNIVDAQFVSNSLR